MNKRSYFILILIFTVTVFTGCTSTTDDSEGWVTLFDGSNLDAWQKSDLWKHKGDTIYLAYTEEDNRNRPRKLDDLYLISKKEYKNFELKFEWRISDNGRSGLKYRYTKKGLEYQILDDVSFPDTDPAEQSASLVWIKEATRKSLQTIASGKFNKARIVANKGLLQHWLNGVKVMEIDMDSDEWIDMFIKNKGKNGKRTITKKDAINFKAYSGFIKIQNCEPGTEIWFKNIYIKELP